jgi:hypothetical protein|tara:strand:- start:1836 stop:2126 length:291 start_codon:yes stop_codon:yes gene_type:complete
MAKTLMQGRKKTTRKNYVNIIQGRKRQSNTKTDKVLEHLKNHGEITSWEAIQMFKATRLSAIIFNLRLQGNNITSEKMSSDNGENYVKYLLNSYLV